MSSDPSDTIPGETPIPEGMEILDVLPAGKPVVVAAPKPPHPNFWWAILWCLLFLIVAQLMPGMVAAIVVGIVMVVNKTQHGASTQDAIDSLISSDGMAAFQKAAIV